MKNKYEVRGDVVVIFLRRRDGMQVECLIDLNDLDRVSGYPGTWIANQHKGKFAVTTMCVRNGKRTHLLLHNFLLGDRDNGDLISYKNGNQLDNRRSNLCVISPLERFLNSIEETEDGCWKWTGSKYSNGYGRFSSGGRVYISHRWSYETFIGSIPNELVLDHLCRNRWCVNPHHLEPVSIKENNLRGTSFCAKNARKTTCIHGHPLSGDNLFINVRGDRGCRICRRKRDKECYERKRSQNG